MVGVAYDAHNTVSHFLVSRNTLKRLRMAVILGHYSPDITWLEYSLTKAIVTAVYAKPNHHIKTHYKSAKHDLWLIVTLIGLNYSKQLKQMTQKYRRPPASQRDPRHMLTLKHKTSYITK